MVGKLSLGDYLILQEAGMIGLPDYVPDHVDADVLEGLSLVDSPFNWYAIGNIVFHILSNDHFMQMLDTWIEQQGGNVQLPPLVEEFWEWQYPEEDSSGNVSPGLSLRRRLITAKLWNRKEELRKLESLWTSNGWMLLSLGEYLDLGLNHQPEVSLAEWLAANPDLECFPCAWCDSDEDRSVGNLDDLIDDEAEEDDADMQVDEDEDVEDFEDRGKDVHLESDILIEGSVGNEHWTLDYRGHFFMNSKRNSSLGNSKYSSIDDLNIAAAFNRYSSFAFVATNRDAVADEDMPQVLSMLCRQVTGQLEASGSGASGSQAGPGPSTEQNLNLQILGVLDRMDLRLQHLEAAGTQPARHVRKGKKSRGKGKGKERARDDMDKYE
ncbi:hypothetical protein EVJ58_g7734 [Rhodofomes roseus]|uniref:Uncharacterized protein n=1 Tax=Rhodofomes roseus TaxID=34475 RepID=A0A4Y9Y2G6_9APHY|nr:hypothetical protein EVJ58_g7734 [Rhodofomes roseus]